jgi:toxin ParE1/3/4
MRLEFSPAADADLVDIASFIARDHVQRAITFIDELEATCTALVDYPHSGAARSDIRDGLRSKPHGSYVISTAFRRRSSAPSAFCTAPAISAASFRPVSHHVPCLGAGGAERRHARRTALPYA